MKVLGLIVGFIVLALVAVAGYMRLNYVETAAFPDRTQAPLLDAGVLETVADLPMPPGNIAVADDGTVYFTFHPAASPEINVARLDSGVGEAFPSADWQPGGAEVLAFQEVLSVRIDRAQQLWALDAGGNGMGTARLLAFDLQSGELTHHHDFERDIFGVGSHANDFQVSRDGRYIFISDASLLARTPALVVYDVQAKVARRLLVGHESVRAGNFEPVVQGRHMTIAGLLTVNPGVDGIALGPDENWLYFASITADQLYRIPVAALIDTSLDGSEVAAQVETFAPKTMTDGMIADAAGNVYLSDIENSAIVRMTPEGKLQTLVKTDKLRWPDGFSLGPDKHLYVTCSSLHQVIGLDPESVRSTAPYQIYRVKLPLTDD